MSSGLPRSNQTRLVRHAHALGLDPNHVLARYGAERFLYRLSRSPHAERFVLKGALMLLVWLGETIRPTRDADLLGFGDLDPGALIRIFAEVCGAPVETDGLEFDAASLRVAPIRPADALATSGAFDGNVLAAAIAATFARRRTVVPRELPLGLTSAFAAVEGKATQWAGFMRRLPDQPEPTDLVTALERVAAFIGPVLLAIGRGERFAARWPPGGPWQ